MSMTISILGKSLIHGSMVTIILKWDQKWEAGHNGCILESLGEIPEWPTSSPPNYDLLSLRFKLGICTINELLYRLKFVSPETRETFTITWEGSPPSLKSFMVAHMCRKSNWEQLLSNWISQNSVRMMEFLGNRDPHLVPKDEMGW